jgi:hypothetical protein
MNNFDVLVLGGGLAGVCASVAAARRGARTALFESRPFVGGNGTSGLPISSFRAHAGPPVVVGGIARELLERTRAKGGFDGDPEQNEWLLVDCEKLQIVLAEILLEAGVSTICHAPLVAAERGGNRIEHLTFLEKDDLTRVSAGVFVDTSGDASLAYKAGLSTPMGRARDGKTQPTTLTFTTGGVNVESYQAAGGGAQLGPLWESLRASHSWRNPRAGSALSWPTRIPGRPHELSWNATRILVDKGTDARLLTQAEMEGRLQIEEFVERFLRPHVPGFASCYISNIARQIGVRETRRIEGEYVLQAADLVECRKFEDAIACNSYPVDIHSPDGGTTEYRHQSLPRGGYYTIPYRSLVASSIDNLLAAGRCLSASHEALAAVRVLSAAMATGEAAGAASALCAQQGIAARDLDTKVLRSSLRQAGAIVD